MNRRATDIDGRADGRGETHGSLSDAIYEEVYRRISAGQWPQGQRLPTELDMAADFGVSRTVVREALLRLRIDGLIVSRPGAGSHVTGRPNRSVMEFTKPGSIADIQRCYEFRVGVEGEAAYLAADRRSPERITAIQAALDSLEACIRNDTGLGAEEDVRFHIAIAHATENDYYVQTIGLAAKAVLVGMKIAHALSPLPPAERLMLAFTEHKEIFAAIAAGDRDEARIRMRGHIESSRRRVFVGV